MTEEAIGSTDDIAGLCLQFLTGLPARITRDASERQRIEAIIHDEQRRLATRFAEIASALRTGVAVADADDEADT